MSSGQLNQGDTQYLTDMRDKMGLSKEEGEKIIKGVQNQRMGANLQAAKAQGSLSLEKVSIRDMQPAPPLLMTAAAICGRGRPDRAPRVSCNHESPTVTHWTPQQWLPLQPQPICMPHTPKTVCDGRAAPRCRSWR